MTANNMTILNQDSTPEEYAALLKGRYVTDITVSSDEASATITLDNGTTLELIGSWGCSCGNGVTYIKHVFQRGGRNARIMNARVETTHDDERYDETDYTIFVMIDGNPTQLPPRNHARVRRKRLLWDRLHHLRPSRQQRPQQQHVTDITTACVDKTTTHHLHS